MRTWTKKTCKADIQYGKYFCLWNLDVCQVDFVLNWFMSSCLSSHQSLVKFNMLYTLWKIQTVIWFSRVHIIWEIVAPGSCWEKSLIAIYYSRLFYCQYLVIVWRDIIIVRYASEYGNAELAELLVKEFKCDVEYMDRMTGKIVILDVDLLFFNRETRACLHLVGSRWRKLRTRTAVRDYGHCTNTRWWWDHAMDIIITREFILLASITSKDCWFRLLPPV